MLNDERCSFEASAFLGLAIDQFAAGEYGQYVYGDGTATGGASTTNSRSQAAGANESSVFGFDIGARFFGHKVPSAKPGFEKDFEYDRQLWMFAKVMHGVRSADINCGTSPSFPSCKNSVADLLNTANAGQEALAILRDATSLEGYFGFRYEFVRLNPQGVPFGTPMNLYLKAQAGFLKVAGVPGSALAMHKVAFGAMATKGPFTDSYMDVGFGRSDIFQYRRRRRFIVDGYLQRKIAPGFSFFAELVADTDLGQGSDSFQTYIGVKFDVDVLWSGKSAVQGSAAPANQTSAAPASSGTSSPAPATTN